MHTAIDLKRFQVQTAHSASLSANSALVSYPVNFIPEYWLVMVRLTAGHILVYPSSGRSGTSFKLDRGTLRLPVETDTLTIETVGATGFYSVYAIAQMDGFSIEL